MTIDIPLPTQVPQLRSLWKEAFGDEDAFLDIFFSTAFSPERCCCITDGEQVVSASYRFDCEYEGVKTAYLYALATAKAYRGQGLARKLMAQLHKQFTLSGYGCAILVPGEPGLADYYASMGYRLCGGRREFTCQAGKTPASLRQITTKEYAALRRKLLPPGSVIQEGENLAFLAAQAGFYAGDGFLLAAQKEGHSLMGFELLGDAAAAPGIVAALQCDSGTFRTPGSTPNAMYLPLGSASIPAPTYLGFDFG